MAGTKVGGLKAAKTNLKRYGKDFYKSIGQRGGLNGHTGGFAANPTLAKLAGEKGGRNSKRGGSWILTYQENEKSFETQKSATTFVIENNIVDYKLVHKF